MSWFNSLFGGREMGTNDLARAKRGPHKFVIASQRIGFLNLQGPTAQLNFTEDKVALEALFASVEDRTFVPPRCDVLLIYCDIETNGNVPSEPIHKSGRGKRQHIC